MGCVCLVRMRIEGVIDYWVLEAGGMIGVFGLNGALRSRRTMLNNGGACN